MAQNSKGGLIRRSSIDALRERINLVDVVQQTVQLRRSGSKFMGKCPFHADSTPSFLVDEKHFKCFGCQVHGDVFKFEQDRSGSSFQDAVESLAGRYNFILEYENNGQESDQERALREEKRSVIHVVTEVTRAYSKYLWTNEGAEALDYMRKRGFSDENLKDWEIGLAPTHNVLLKMAEKRGWDLRLLESAGLLKKREDRDEWFDFFRDRIMIPIRDDKGNPIAFGGRIFKPTPEGREPLAKYKNSPATALFHKSKVLFNLSRAQKAIVQAGFVVVVEGYMDCLALACAGIPNVVAVLGVALSVDHLRKLSRFTKRVVLCFDSDKAGRKAALDAFEIGFPLNLVELEFVSVPTGKDPDEFIRLNGIGAFKGLLDRAVPLASWVSDLYLALGNSREANVRKIKSDFVPIVMKNPDPAVREVTLSSVASALGLSSFTSLTAGIQAHLGRLMESSRFAGESTRQLSGQGIDSKERSPVNEVDNEKHLEANDQQALFLVSSGEEATFFLACAHAPFSILPDRLQRVLRGEQSDQPMDEIVLAQLLSDGFSPVLRAAFLAWWEFQLQHEHVHEAALVDLQSGLVPTDSGIPQMRALASLDPEALLDSGLESWVRGVLEPGLGASLRPQLRKPENLLDPSNLPFVRMIVKDIRVSRARSNLSALLGRVLAQIEISHLDSEIDKTTRNIRSISAGIETPELELADLQIRLRRLSDERLRRHQKFMVRLNN
ncbi:DNA primase [bacterium]|nr:DNA primase [bacterium]